MKTSFISKCLFIAVLTSTFVYTEAIGGGALPSWRCGEGCSYSIYRNKCVCHGRSSSDFFLKLGYDDPFDPLKCNSTSISRFNKRRCDFLMKKILAVKKNKAQEENTT